MILLKDKLHLIKAGTAEILLETELIEKLKNENQLRIKAGFDPTTSDLHLGHTVLLNKLKKIQDLGHKIIILIGDYTAQIGDPSGNNITRPNVSQNQILKNASTYKEQIDKILDPNNTDIVFNSKWIQNLSSKEFISITSYFTIARMLERYSFKTRYINQQPIAIHEFIYPLLQAYDSVCLKNDIEIGGVDQKFNLLIGRELQKIYGQDKQIIITMPLLKGTDGIQKMSKSLNNCINLKDPPLLMYNKLVSIPDTLIFHYFQLLSFRSFEEIQSFRKDIEKGSNPRDIKIKLAEEIINRLYGIKINKLKILHENIPEITCISSKNISIASLLNKTKLVKNAAIASDLLKNGRVKINGKIVNYTDIVYISDIFYIIQIGKKIFAKVFLKQE